VWDGSLRLRRLIHTGASDALSCAFSTDGRVLVTAGPAPAVAWDPGPRRFPGHGPLAFSWSGEELAVCRRRPRVLKLITTPARQGRQMADMGHDVSVYDLDSGVARETHSFHNEYGVLNLEAMAMTPDGDVLLASREDHELFEHRRLWRWRPGRAPALVEAETGFVSMAVATNGATLLVGPRLDVHRGERRGDIELRSLPDLEREARFEWHARAVIALQLLEGGGFLSASRDGSVAWWAGDAQQRPKKIMDALTGAAVKWESPDTRDWKGCSIGDSLCVMSYSPERRIVAAGFGDGRVRLWRDDLSAFDPKELRGHEHELVLCAFQPGGDQLVTASKEGKVRVWDVARGTVLRTIEPPVRRVDAATLSRDGKRLALASAGDVWVYSLAGD
jgi:WD40 repeat protein